MNSKDIRNYWINKYNIETGKEYKSDNFLMELSLIKKLITKYKEYIVLEAIDIFLENSLSDIKLIKYFTSQKFFKDNFYYLIYNETFVRCKRLYYNDSRFRPYLDEYKHYLNCLCISDSEKVRRKELISILTDLENKVNESTGT